jgi:transposase
MRKIAEVLRLKYEARRTHREIAVSCDISPSTVSEYVTAAKAAGISWPLPEGMTPKALNERLFPDRNRPASQIPQPDWAYVHRELKRKSVTLSLLWVEYRRREPEGYSYSQFCHRYRKWAKQLTPTLRLPHKAGEKVFVDYAGQTVPIIDPDTGEVSAAQIFVGVLGASNYTYVEAHASQRLPNWIGAHVRMFDCFGGVPEVVVPDNLKAGVTAPHRYEPDLNPTYHEFARHYGVAVVPARSRKPKDKAKVETGVQVVERWILARLRDRQFFSLAELNAAITPLSAELNARPMKHLGQSRAELFAALDQPQLRALPTDHYEYAEWKQARVNIDQHVAFDKRFYSVPFKLTRKQVLVRATERTIEIYYQQQRVAGHARLRRQGAYATVRDHLPPAHQHVLDWSPERFQAWAQEIGEETHRLIGAVLQRRPHPQQAYRSCLGILRLAKKVGNDRLEAACRRAVAAGIFSYRGIANILDNQLDRLPLDPPSPTPQPPHANIRGEEYYQ